MITSSPATRRGPATAGPHSRGVAPARRVRARARVGARVRVGVRVRKARVRARRKTCA